MTDALALHAPVLPVLLPAATAVVLLLLGDAPARRPWARRIAVVSVGLGLLLAALLAVGAADGSLRVYRVGDWPAPFGIALVVDRLAALMLLLTACVALPVIVYAAGGWDAHGRHFHPMFQFQLMGLNGAFVTGDLFNLFVFFEVLLIASYVLMLHGQGRARFGAGLHYVVLNLVGSALFLVGVSLLYAMTGTLNLADLALRVPQVQGADATLVRAAGLILLVVFGFKAALMPLALWLPATYAAAAPPVAALFAIMTWLTVASVGTVLAGLGLFRLDAWSAAIYYMANSTLVIAGLFLLSELVAAQRGDAGAKLEPAQAVAQPALLGTMLLLGAASVAGLPPLPGFIGKLMLLEAALPHGAAAWVWAVVLTVGFLTLVGLARAGSILFWKVRGGATTAAGASPPLLLATGALLAGSIAMAVFAAPLKRYTDAAALQLLDREAYARAVLGDAAASNTRPYRVPAEAPR